MPPIAVGSPVPPVPGLDVSSGPVVLFFYKVTCPTCQLAAPKVRTFERAYPGHALGVGQDPADRLAAFDAEFGLGIPTVSDAPRYEASAAFGVEVVPTLFLVGTEGAVLDLAESWDRDGYNRISRRLAELLGAEYVPVSDPGDGLPPFRPG